MIETVSVIKEIEYPTYTTGPVASMSWGAILAGAFVSAASAAGLGLLGVGAGLSHVTSWGGAIYMGCAAPLAFASGGWVTGRMTRSGVISESAVHALSAWAVVIVAFGVGHYLFPAAASPSRQFTGIEAFLYMCNTALASGIAGSLGTRLLRPHPLSVTPIRTARV